MKQIIFNNIYKNIKNYFSHEIFQNIKTIKGNTQNIERSYQNIIRKIITDMGYKFSEASSQQPYDFKINIPEKNEILNLEIKKTDSFNIYFNDTCPNKDIYYIIIFTGKKYKIKKSIEPCIIGVNGNEFIKNCSWIFEYQKELEQIKNKYTKIKGNMSVYPRPTFKSDIRFLLSNNNKNIT